MTELVKGDRVKLSAKGLEGAQVRGGVRPEDRRGTIVGYAKDYGTGRCLRVQWDHNKSPDGATHESFFEKVSETE